MATIAAVGAPVSGVTAAPLRKRAVRAVLSRASRRPAAAVASRRGLQAQGLRPPRAPRGRRGVRGCGQGEAGGGRRKGQEREDAGGGLTPLPRSRPAPRGGVDVAASAERRGVGAGCGGTRLPASAYCESLVRTQPFSTCTTSREFQPAFVLASQRVNAVQLLPFGWAVGPPKLLANAGFHGHPSPAVPNSPAAKAQTPFPFLWMSVASASCIQVLQPTRDGVLRRAMPQHSALLNLWVFYSPILLLLPVWQAGVCFLCFLKLHCCCYCLVKELPYPHPSL